MEPQARSPVGIMPGPSTDALSRPENILDYAIRGMLVADADWRIRYVNRTLLHAIGCSAEDLLGEHLLVAANKVQRRDSGGDLLHYLVRLAATAPEQTQ